MNDDPQAVVDLLESVWNSLAELCRGLDAEEWDLPTDCPGWTVKDQLSHIIGTELMLAGKPTPEHKPDPKPYVKNPIGEFNEVHVDYRRPMAPEDVLAEFLSLTKERLESLRAMSPEEFERQTMTPVGPDSYLEFMRIRVFDCWVHEQDIRRATGRSGNLSGPVARHSVGRCFKAMPYVVAKKAGALDGAVVTFEISYPAPENSADSLAVVVKDGRGSISEEFPERPTAAIRTDVATYVALCCGRIEPEDALKRGDVILEGDKELAEKVVRNLAFMI